jgi:hypothetical protein
MAASSVRPADLDSPSAGFAQEASEAETYGYTIPSKDFERLVKDRDLDILTKMGGIDTIARALKTDLRKGLTGHEVVEASRSYYGPNRLPQRKTKSYFMHLWEAIQVSVRRGVRTCRKIHEPLARPRRALGAGSLEPWFSIVTLAGLDAGYSHRGVDCDHLLRHLGLAKVSAAQCPLPFSPLACAALSDVRFALTDPRGALAAGGRGGFARGSTVNGSKTASHTSVNSQG